MLWSLEYIFKVNPSSSHLEATWHVNLDFIENPLVLKESKDVVAYLKRNNLLYLVSKINLFKATSRAAIWFALSFISFKITPAQQEIVVESKLIISKVLRSEDTDINGHFPVTKWS